MALVSLGGGHPPPMVFVPHVLIAGLIGQLVLLGVRGLTRLGRRRSERMGHPGKRWPVELAALAILLGGIGLFGTAVVIKEIGLLFTHPHEWLFLAAVTALHLLAFTTLLLRISWSRRLAAAASAGWAIALTLQLGEARRGELPIALLLIVALAGVAVYVVRSDRVRSALE